MTKIVFMGSPEFALPSLRALHARQGSQTPDERVVGVVTQPDRASGRGRELKMPPVKTLALELARFNIAVNCIAPGGTKTRMTAAIPENIMANLIERIPLKRFADPCEIAAVHAFLASDEASFITGQCVFVDGGQTVGA